MPDLVIDYAWQHPDPAAIKASGYVGVLRYLSNDPSKDLDVLEKQRLQALGLHIGVVWETTASRAADGYAAGQADAIAANAHADALGLPRSMAIYFATDFDATADQVRPYYQGAVSMSARSVGAYGGIGVVDPLLLEGIVRYGWQTVAWSGGAVSRHAHLYQRLTPTLPPPGAAGSYDEDVVLQGDWGQAFNVGSGGGTTLPNIPPGKVPPMARAAVPGKIIHAWGGWSPDMKLMDIFMVSDDGNLYHSWWNAAASAWNGPETLNTGG